MADISLPTVILIGLAFGCFGCLLYLCISRRLEITKARDFAIMRDRFLDGTTPLTPAERKKFGIKGQ
jgi:hypothetical protein